MGSLARVIGVLPELVIGPLLVACAALACRRWSHRVGGLISALPAVVGPVLLISAQERGLAFAAHAANATLLGLAALAAFAYAYAAMAPRARWQTSLGAGWACAAIASILLGGLGGGIGFPVGLVVATVSLGLAYAAMPVSAPSLATRSMQRSSIWPHVVLTAALVAALATAAQLFGALIGGVLAALPVLASVLVVSTHRQDGAAAAIALLRGMLSGMRGFVGFCAVVAVLIGPAGTAAAFAAATLTTLGLQIPATRGRLMALAWSHRGSIRRARYAGLEASTAECPSSPFSCGPI